MANNNVDHLYKWIKTEGYEKTVNFPYEVFGKQLLDEKTTGFIVILFKNPFLCKFSLSDLGSKDCFNVSVVVEEKDLCEQLPAIQNLLFVAWNSVKQLRIAN
jgi:hypothetical protein